jgi:glycerophosphoryl diester phosphodiesterase
MLVLGHRGVHGRTISENTIEAFHEAIRQGADGIEFDLRASRDGEMVVVHDVNLHRVAGDAHRVAELTASQLAQVSLRAGGSIPTLHDVTSHIHAPHLLDIEVKHRDVIETLIVKLGTSSALRERTIVSSFHASVLMRVRRAHPDVRTLFLVPRWPLPLQGKRFFTKLLRLKPWAVACPVQILNPKRVDHLRSYGWSVGAWDVRGTLGEARKIQRLGLDVAIVRHVREVRIPQGDLGL